MEVRRRGCAAEPRPDRPGPRPGAGRRARGVRRGRPVGAGDPARHRARTVAGHQRQQGHPPVRAPRRAADERRGQRRREGTGPRDRGRPPRPRREPDVQGRAPRQGVHRLEPEQRLEDDDRAVLAARPRRAHGRRAAYVGGTRRPGTPPPAVPRGPGTHGRPPRRDRSPGGSAARLYREAHGRPHARARSRAPACRSRRRGTPPLRDPGAPRVAPALGRAARTRRRAGQLGGPERGSADDRQEQPRGDDRGPPDAVPRLRGRDPARTVRRGHHDRLGHRHVRAREMAGRRGHRDPHRSSGRAARARSARPHPHRGLRREVAVAAPPDEDGCRGPAAGRGAGRGPPRGSCTHGRRNAVAHLCTRDRRRPAPHAGHLFHAGPGARGRRALGPGVGGDEVGRHPRDRDLGRGAPEAPVPQWKRPDGRLPRAHGRRPWSGRSSRRDRRGDRRARRPGAAELPAAAEAYEPRPGARHRARSRPDPGAPVPVRRTGGGRPRRHGTPARGTPRDPRAPCGGRGSRRRGAARLRRRRGRTRGQRTIRTRGHRRERCRIALPPRREIRPLAQGQALPHAGGRHRRHPSREGQPLGHDRVAPGRCAHGRWAAVRRTRRFGLRRADARAPVRGAGAPSHGCRSLRRRAGGRRPRRPVGAARPRGRGGVRRVHALWHPAPGAVARPPARQGPGGRRPRGLSATRAARRARRDRRVRAGTSSARRRSGRRGTSGGMPGCAMRDRRSGPPPPRRRAR